MKRLRATLSINFYCRASRVGKDGLAPVEMAVNVNGERFFVNLPRRFKPQSFSKKLPDTFKDYLSGIENNIRAFETACVVKGKRICAADIREYIRNGFSSPVENIGYAIKLFYFYVDEKPIGEKVKRKYRLVMDTFLSLSGLSCDDALIMITPGVCRTYVEKMKKQYRNSTYTGMLCRFKSFLSFCVDNRLLESNPFSGIRIRKDEVKIETITEDEYKKIKDLDLSWCERLLKVRNLFIFACGTGLAYTDTQKLMAEDFKVNDRGQVYLSKERNKTGVNYTVVVLPDALEVAKHYNYVLPSISNQRLNTYLKEIQDLAGIKTNITFHKARHFYACMLLNKFQFSLEVVARCLGHTSTKMTSHYAKLFNTTIFDQFENIM